MDAEYFAVDDLHAGQRYRDPAGREWAGWETHRSQVEIIEDVTACFPYRGATVLLLTLLSMRCRTAEERAGRERAYHKIRRPALFACSRGFREAARSYQGTLTKKLVKKARNI